MKTQFTAGICHGDCYHYFHRSLLPHFSLSSPTAANGLFVPENGGSQLLWNIFT